VRVADDARTTQLERENATLRRELREARLDNERLKLKLDQLAQRLFGCRSEKLAPVQLGLLDDTEPPVPDVPDDEATHEPPPEKRQHRHGRKPLSKDLPRERVVHEVPESERTCRCCGELMQPLRARDEADRRRAEA
jgi:hypothetical protein